MNTKLQANIKKRLSVRSLSVSELERRAGLKQSTVQNILHGRSKNPSIETIKCIAQELNCSIEELIGEIVFSGASDNASSSPGLKAASPSTTGLAEGRFGAEEESSWNADLFIKAIITVQTILDKKNIKLPKKQILASVEEVYKYSIGISEDIDRRFAEWIIEKILRTSAPT
jgi:transcriptional regulator with XRE-family HTH domain